MDRGRVLSNGNCFMAMHLELSLRHFNWIFNSSEPDSFHVRYSVCAFEGNNISWMNLTLTNTAKKLKSQQSMTQKKNENENSSVQRC